MKLTRNSVTWRVIWSHYGEVLHYITYIIPVFIVADAAANLLLIRILRVISDVIVPLAFDRIFS